MSDIPPAQPAFYRRRPAVSILGVLVLVLVVIGAWYWWSHRDAEPAGASAQGGAAAKDGKAGKAGAKGGRFGAGGGGPQPVQAATAKLGNVNIVQTALGTAAALRNVIVKPRVDGLLQRLLFTEGQMVKEGDTLAQLDPVPFQVALAQAEGTLARDAAQLNNARLDLDRYQTLLKQDSIAQQLVDQQASMVRQLEGTVKI